VLVELRSTGGHSFTPSSVHPEGETLAWTHQGEPVQADLETLQSTAAIRGRSAGYRLGFSRALVQVEGGVYSVPST